MNKPQIEDFVTERLRRKIESAIRECVQQLNAEGHGFEPVDELLNEWREPRSDACLSIHCALGVHYQEQPSAPTPPDPILNAFVARADSGLDPEATLLNQLETEINNGGFFQLYNNKGLEFMKYACAILAKIGSRSRRRLLDQAIALLDSNDDIIHQHARFQQELHRLDRRYYSLKESIPALFEKSRNTP